MQVLIVGYSDIVRRRSWQGLAAQASVATIGVATSKPERVREVGPAKLGSVTEGYGAGIDRSDAELVYVSTVQSAHFELARRALESGKHVAIDKPATCTLAECQALCDLAEARGLFLAEYIPYHCHPQVEWVRARCRDATDGALLINAYFSFPGLRAGNFRLDPALGGGSILDQGPYLADIWRLLARRPQAFELTAQLVHRHPETGVPMAWHALLRDDAGSSCTAHFGFNSAYINQLQVITSEEIILGQRFFTTAATAPAKIWLRRNQDMDEVTLPAADSFELAWAQLCRDVGDPQTYERYRREMLLRARIVESIRSQTDAG